MKYLPNKRPVPVSTVLATSILSALASYSGVAVGQDRQLEEIVITTERRTTTEDTTAISMEVLTDEFIADNQIKDIVDLQNAVPNMQFFQNGSYVQANIRGVGNPSTGGPSEQVGVPVFFDGATQGEEMSLASGFFDIENVQVLRGPQATFVGQSAAGGAILINSARPDFSGEVSGFVEAQAGTYATRKVQGAMNLPITDTLAGRIAFMGDTRDSFYHNVSGAQSTGGKVNTPGDQVDQNYRLSLLWEPNEKLSVYGKLEYTHLEANGIPQQPNPRSYTGFWDDDGDPNTPSLKVTSYGDRSQGPAPGTGFMVNDVWYGGTPGAGGAIYDPLDPFVIDRRYENWRIQKNVRQSLEINYELDSGIRLRSLTSNIEMDRKQAEAGDSAAFQDVTGWHLGGPDMRTWSQEFNIISPDDQRLRWLLGAYHSDRHTDLSLNIALDNPDCGWQYDSSWTPCPTSGESQTRLYWTSDDDVKHTGYYVQLNYDVTDDLELTVEARLNKDDNVQLRQLEVPRVQQLLNFGPFAAATELCPGQINGSTFYCTPNAGDLNYPTSPPLVWKDDIMTYKVGLNWEPWDNHFFYIFSARGYKSGQSVTFGAPPVTEEVVDDFELGWKGTVLDGRLYAELGYFNMDYTDMQLSSFVTGVTESTTAVRNAGASSIEGFEGTFRFFVGNLALNGSFGYTDSKLGSIQTIDTRALPIAPPGPGAPWPGNTAQGCTGDFCFDYTPYQLTLNGANGLFSPEWTWTLGADYSFGLSNGASITPAVSFNHSDMANTSIIQQPGDAYFTAEERDIMNLTLTYRNEDWEVQLYGTNVTDEVFIEGTSGASVLYGDPEVWGIRARMDF